MKGGAAQDIDDAALQAISNGIGSANRNELKQTVSLSFQLKNLPNLDMMSKTDAFIVLYQMRQSGQGKGSRMMKHKLGQTEVVWDNLDPTFVKTFTVDYFFEETQDFRIEAYDMDDESKPNDMSAHDYIGCLDFKLSQVVTGRDQTLTAKMQQAPKGAPQVTITAENIKRGGQTALLKFHGQFKTSSEVFYIIWKELSPGKWKPVYKSEAQVKQGGQHKFREAVLNTSMLGDDDQEFRVDFMIAQDSGNHTLIGSDTLSIAGLQGGKN